MKRIVLFLLTNLFVMVTLSIVLNLLGVRPYLDQNGIDYQSLMIFCLVWGMGGALISLAISRMSAKWMMGIKLINPQQPGEYAWLYQMVQRLSQSAGLPNTPEVGVWNGADLNAFATGPTKSRSLVAFSSGLLSQMSRDEVEGVAAHEIAHIQNGNMVTMTLIQGVVNAFVMFFARIIAFAVSQFVKDDARHLVRVVATILLDIVFSILALIVVGWFSRQREFRADSGSAKLAGREKMISALEALKKRYDPRKQVDQPASLAALQISGKSGGLLSLFATHPPLDVRIEALRKFA